MKKRQQSTCFTWTAYAHIAQTLPLGFGLLGTKQRECRERHRERERRSSINYAYDTLNEYTAKAVINSSRGFKQKKRHSHLLFRPKPLWAVIKNLLLFSLLLSLYSAVCVTTEAHTFFDSHSFSSLFFWWHCRYCFFAFTCRILRGKIVWMTWNRLKLKVNENFN